MGYPSQSHHQQPYVYNTPQAVTSYTAPPVHLSPCDVTPPPHVISPVSVYATPDTDQRTPSSGTISPSNTGCYDNVTSPTSSVSGYSSQSSGSPSDTSTTWDSSVDSYYTGSYGIQQYQGYYANYHYTTSQTSQVEPVDSYYTTAHASKPKEVYTTTGNVTEAANQQASYPVYSTADVIKNAYQDYAYTTDTYDNTSQQATPAVSQYHDNTSQQATTAVSQYHSDDSSQNV